MNKYLKKCSSCRYNSHKEHKCSLWVVLLKHTDVLGRRDCTSLKNDVSDIVKIHLNKLYSNVDSE